MKRVSLNLKKNLNLLQTFVEKEKRSVARQVSEPTSKSPDMIPAPKNKPVGLNMGDFLPVSTMNL